MEENKVQPNVGISEFLEGRDPQERIVNLSYKYKDDYITVIYRDEQDRKCLSQQPFYPFLWATRDACLRLCNGDRTEVKKLMTQFGIKCRALDYKDTKGNICEKMLNGYLFIFEAQNPMAYSDFLRFFKKAGNPVYGEKDKNGNEKKRDAALERQYMVATPQEQYLIRTGKRFFKGYEDYDDLLRCTFDLETEGLDANRHRIISIGIRFNRPVTYKNVTKEFSKVLELEGNTEDEKNRSELRMIDTMLRILYTFKPDVITGHNSENFDWNFIIKRCTILGLPLEELSKRYFDGESIRKDSREAILKLGGEVEKFQRTIVPNITVTDSLHAVRRAQATDSSFKKADLKYATQYLKLGKKNRVYVPGSDIAKISDDYEEHYAFNNEDGYWYVYDPIKGSDSTTYTKENSKAFKMTTRKNLLEGFTLVSGHYIVQRYLEDDIWECDKVEYALNGTDFMLTKIIPIPYQKVVTMGTAGLWKAIMLAWSYEQNLAIPKAENTGAFTGGLSRLLRVGFVKDVVKLDYNSLYPSIILTWGISDETDLKGSMLSMLEYVLTTREKHKNLKKAAGKIVDEYEAEMNNGKILTEEEREEYSKAGRDFKIEDNRQASVKKLGNSFFGSYGSNNGSVFPWKSPTCAERTTCTGRMALRLMISHFKNLGYEPIVGDSFTEDTPVFIRYTKTGEIDIKPISELINEDAIEIDALGREYDYSPKNYQVLCRSGWVSPSYIYRHKTDKDIYEIADGDMRIEVTEDHSLFDSKQKKIKPSAVNGDTELEYFTNNKVFKESKILTCDARMADYYAKELADGKIDRVPKWFLNRAEEGKKFYAAFIENQRDDVEYSKTCLAGLQFLKFCSK